MSVVFSHVVDIVVPESQYGFRRQRVTIVDHLLQQKCREQHRNLCLHTLISRSVLYERTTE